MENTLAQRAEGGMEWMTDAEHVRFLNAAYYQHWSFHKVHEFNMRLRLTVRRHGLPDAPVVWIVDTSSSPSPTISQLLEAVNEAIPIESDGDWGLEDYAVELKGTNGANYECLHFQHVAAVMKEDDEVIIRPLLTQDIKIRRVSGRRQISAEGKHLYDGLAFGRPLLRRPADRPPITIPPRKKRRVTYDDEEHDEEDIPALMEQGEEESDSDANKQLVLHADFDDEDSDDDEDFVPGGDDEGEDEGIDDEDNDNADEEVNEDSNPMAALIASARELAKDYADELESESEMDEDAAETSNQSDDILAEVVAKGNEVHDEYMVESLDQSEDVQTKVRESLETPVEGGLARESPGASEVKDVNESALNNVPESRRVKIRKLHSAFPKSPMAVCKYVLNGTNGDMGEAYEAMARGFRPVKSKNAITEIFEDTSDLSISKTRSQAKTPMVIEPDSRDIVDLDSEETSNSVLHHYDQRGLPPGSIKSGKALSFMAEALHSSPSRPRSETRRSASVVSNKSIRFAMDEELSHGLTSTPFIDKESQVVESSEDSESDDSSDDDSDSSDSSDESSDAEESGAEESGPGDASSSGSDSSSDLSSDSSSEDDSPEETSSKPSSTAPAPADTESPSSNKANSKQGPTVPPGQGLQATRKRNQRRKLVNALDRYKKKGILPAGTTLTELSKLDINDNTPPEVALVALEDIRASKTKTPTHTLSPAQAQPQDFERRRQQLLESLASGGIEVSSKSYGLERPTSVQSPIITEPTHTSSSEAGASQSVPASFTSESEQVEPKPMGKAVTAEVMNLDAIRPSTAPELPKLDTPLPSPKPQPISAEPSHSAARRSKLDLGAGRRLLFGALGVKVPRSKKDEEKLRSDLMKDVRPLVAPKPSETIESLAEAVEEDPEAWREKIIYRAVECVQEGVELSEPPFPFIQRWDPQQQRSWSHNGKRKQAEHPQYYQENPRASKKQKRRKGKHNYAEEQEYLDASYEPSYQDESLELQYDDSTQFTRPEDEDVEGEISLQLMNGIEGPDAAFSQNPDDLISLPDDPSSLPDLRAGEAKVGMIIAFKKLDLSAATQWQPIVSPYRTAIVITVHEDGLLQLALAMRDRERSEKRYDEETGGRIYEKFEMAVDDDNDEIQQEDGMLDLYFSDLMEPKIVQQPPAKYENDIIVDEAPQLKEAISFDDSTTLSQQEEPIEAPLSHVTETPLHSDAPESHHMEEAVEVPVAENPLPKVVFPAAAVVESVSVQSPTPVETGSTDSSLRKPAVKERYSVHPAISAAHSDDDLSTRNDISPEPISEDTRQQIAHLMKDADFRSDVPSSVLRDIQPESMQSPGEAADLEKLLKDMTEQNDKAYSPKFNGLGSSPIKKLRESSRSPSEGRVEVRDSSPTRKRKEHPQGSVNERQSSNSPSKAPQSSWETVDPHYQSPTPPPTRQADSSWITEDSQIHSSSPPVPKPAKASPKIKSLSTKAPIGRAQALWEALQPKARKKTPDSDAESTRTSPDPVLQLDGVDEKGSNTSVQYPKLSAASSFTSQITDHGHQPDFNFDDSGAIGNDASKAVDSDAEIMDNYSPEPHHKRQPSRFEAASKIAVNDDPFDSMSDLEPSPPARIIGNQKRIEPPPRPAVPDDPSTDDDTFPSLEALSQQSATIKREKSREKSTKPARPTKVDKPLPTARASVRVGEQSDTEDQTTPKASQKQRASYKDQELKKLSSEKPISQSRASVPRASQPLASQNDPIDLTLDSSDAEPVAQPLAEESDDIQPVRFRRYKLDDDDDEEFQDESKWASKKTNTLGGVETRRHTSVGLKNSSQTSLNSKNRRKTSAQ
ncbi:hypothetical protein EG329_013008 [Mollisiaceae sp. DMI_Dod_QoI]|nr:hypothetical protein EG329_013008 [Helotiales sp. DMI_Dod_QoI]